MNKKIEKYHVNSHDTIEKVLKVFQYTSDNRMPTGIAVVVDSNKNVVGVISEGDIRRALLKNSNIDSQISHIYQSNPITFNDKLSFSEIIDIIPNELKKRNRKSIKFLKTVVLINDNNKLTRVLSYHELWEQKVATHRHVVALGLGYVGLTLALVLADKGFYVTGVDPDLKKIKSLNKKESYVFELGLPELLREQLNKNFIPQSEIPDQGDVFIISVGTPVKKNSKGSYDIELKYLKNLCDQLGKKLKTGNLVILRSTVPIGTSRNIVIPILEKTSKLKCGVDFHLSFAPERTAEGVALRELRELPQIIGGINNDSVESTVALFRELTPTLVRVSTLEAAEMVKLINNSFRDIIFSYSNYVSQIASEFNLNIVEIIKAANQGYKRDPVPLPSPGVGGPCLTKDPYIFSSISNVKYSNRSLFEHGRIINESMHLYVVKRLLDQIITLNKDYKKIKVLVCGLAFKGMPQTGDVRNSSSVEIYHILSKKIKNIYGHDPVAKIEDIKNENVKPISFEEGINNSDVVLFLNNHIFYQRLDVYTMCRKMSKYPIIFDGWKLFRSKEILESCPSVYMDLSQTLNSIS